ncbi:MAG: threonine/serine dehydratase [Anaerolineae bacterium]|nr:threonine/serine dehydratase [Anaerolineae bacterium]
MVHISDIVQARHLLAQYLLPTPLEHAPGIGDTVWLKLENVNLTHSFKVRGALNAVLSLDKESRAKGLVAASSGNHAGALAYAAHVARIPARIVMPVHTPRRKVRRVTAYGAEAVLFGETYDEAEAEGRRLEKEEHLTYISPYNDPQVIAGAGTIGLEILDALTGVERVLVPVSGGGLISGVALALKASNPAIEVIGVCAESAPAMYNVFYNLELPQVWETLAEALSGAVEEGSITVGLSHGYVDRIVLVSEAQIAEAMRWMLFDQGWVVEGGGAAGVAALMSGVVTNDDRRTAIVVSGGNVDEDTLRDVLGHER